jgi:hypothetical protein
MTALTRPSSNCTRHTRSPVRVGAPHQKTCKCLTLIKTWFWVLDKCLTPRHTRRLTVGRNITLTLFRVRVTLQLTVSQSVRPSSWPDIYSCMNGTVLSVWGTLSDERTALTLIPGYPLFIEIPPCSSIVFENLRITQEILQTSWKPKVHCRVY